MRRAVGGTLENANILYSEREQGVGKGESITTKNSQNKW